MERRESKIIINFLERQLELKEFNEDERRGYLTCLQILKDNCPTEPEYTFFSKECNFCHANLNLKENRSNWLRQKMTTLDLDSEFNYYYYDLYTKCPKCKEKVLFGIEHSFIDISKFEKEHELLSSI